MTTAKTPLFLDHLISWRDRGKAPVIAEIKMKSQKEGPLMENRSVEGVVAQYVKGGAACLSVVTGRWFGGDMKLFDRVRRLTDLPILRKDFIASRKELEISQAAGADAVLLTRRLLQPEVLMRLAEEAILLGMVPFVEIADEKELATTVLPGGAILAINNRDIRVKETDDGDYRNSLRLSAGLQSSPAALVSASGISSAQEAASLIEAGFDSLLIGTALLRSPDIVKFIDNIRAAVVTPERKYQHAC